MRAEARTGARYLTTGSGFGMPNAGPGGPMRDSAYGVTEEAQARKYVQELATYSESNASTIVNNGERYRSGERISTGFVESTINHVVSRRMVKKQQVQRTPEGAHLLLQVRIQVLNDDWEATFRTWYPGFRPSIMAHTTQEAA